MSARRQPRPGRPNPSRKLLGTRSERVRTWLWVAVFFGLVVAGLLWFHLAGPTVDNAATSAAPGVTSSSNL